MTATTKRFPKHRKRALSMRGWATQQGLIAESEPRFLLTHIKLSFFEASAWAQCTRSAKNTWFSERANHVAHLTKTTDT